MTDRESQIERISDAALKREGTARAAFLDEACAGDTALKRDVESLLAQESAAKGFLSTPAAALAAGLMGGGTSFIGRQLGPYVIQARLGAGGMGEVYRAHDTKLGRDVAIKILPSIFTRDPERLARFEREARLLAALNHPNIGAIYGLEDVDGVPSLILELVEGETLAERIAGSRHQASGSGERRSLTSEARGLPISDALTIASQIADALEAAHEHSIVHRDLKPANIVVHDLAVKVLDFGLAKAIVGDAAGPDLSQSPAITSYGARDGVILGTASYISPEQARGRPVDKRTDIWAFGCVLYEMLAGRVAFSGDTLTDTIAAVLRGEPDWQALPATTPDGIRRLLKRCVEKDHGRRLRDIGDARLEIFEALAAPTDSHDAELQWPAGRGTANATAPPKHLSWLVTAVLTLGLGLVAALVPATLYFRRVPVGAPETRFEIPAPRFASNLLISPNGRTVAYVASSEGKRAIWVGPIGSLTTQRLTGTDNASGLFWSPDSRHLAFFADGKLKKIDVFGGAAQTLCDSALGLPGAWNRDDVILFGGFAGGAQGLLRISAFGGAVTPVTVADVSKEYAHVQPQFLPDGHHFIYHAVDSNQRDGALYLGSLDSTSTTRLLMVIPNIWQGTNSPALYAAPGYLLFSRDGRLRAQLFDTVRMTLSGEPVALGENVSADFSVSENGVLVYRKVTDQPREQPATLLWFDRKGKPAGQVATPVNVEYLRLSPDGQQIAVDNAGPANHYNSDIWVIGVTRAAPLKLTFDSGFDGFPVWAPDGRRIVFAAVRGGHVVSKLYQKRADGVGAEDLLLPDNTNDVDIPYDWSSDDRYIIFERFGFNAMAAANDIWFLPLFGDKKPSLFLHSSFPKVQPQLSPDGRYLAYATNESGTYQIVVQSFPDPTKGKWPITSQGGTEPSWRRDGRELYYLAPDGKLMAVTVRGEPTFEPGQPTSLFQTALTPKDPRFSRRYAVTADGQRFLTISSLNAPVSDTDAAPITAIVNWTAALKK